MLGHRVNSEGLRGRANAPSGGAPKRTYIGFGDGFCQPFRAQCSKRNRQLLPVFAICGLAFHHRRAPRPRVCTRVCIRSASRLAKALDYRQIRSLSARRAVLGRARSCSVVLGRTRPHLGHIPRPILAQSVGCREHGV